MNPLLADLRERAHAAQQVLDTRPPKPPPRFPHRTVCSTDQLIEAHRWFSRLARTAAETEQERDAFQFYALQYATELASRKGPT